MATTTPQVTLTATLDDQTGQPIPKSRLIITLCGYGPMLPIVSGAANIAKVGPVEFVLLDGTTDNWQNEDGDSGTNGIPLWGNDVILPAFTFYSIAVADQKKNVIQCGMYQFSGSGSIDLSNAVQLPAVPGSPLYADNVALSGPIDGINAVFRLPQTPQPPASVQLYKNGVLQKQGTDYNMQGEFVIYLPVSIPQPGGPGWPGDAHVAYYRYVGSAIWAQQPPKFADGEAPAGAIDGTNRAFTLAHVPNPALSLQFFYNGTLFRSGVDYTLAGNLITYLNFAPMTGDSHEAFYRY